MVLWFLNGEDAAAFARRYNFADPVMSNDSRLEPRQVVGWRGQVVNLDVQQAWRLLFGVEVPDGWADIAKVRTNGDRAEVTIDRRAIARLLKSEDEG